MMAMTSASVIRGPAAPGAPRSPCGPVAPVEPRSPVAPRAPVSPFAPVAPVAPAAPVSPFGPCGPAGPLAPGAAAFRIAWRNAGDKSPIWTPRMSLPVRLLFLTSRPVMRCEAVAVAADATRAAMVTARIRRRIGLPEPPPGSTTAAPFVFGLVFGAGANRARTAPTTAAMANSASGGSPSPGKNRATAQTITLARSWAGTFGSIPSVS